MARLHRILWSEGLFLTPHHFQQMELFREHQLAERSALATPHPWGVSSLEIDPEGLASGTFRLLSFRGLLPSGVSINFPEIDPAPPSVDFREAFDIRADHIDVYLGLPVRRNGWPNCRLSADGGEDSAEIRYTAMATTVDDENTGRDERTIQRAELNLRLLLGTESRDNFECLPVARVEKSASGGFHLAESFVPPLLALEGSPFLTKLTRSLLEQLVTASSGLGAGFTEGGADGRDITPANLRFFLRLLVVNGVIPQLAYLRETGASHPADLYRVLAGLVGQLATFDPGRTHPRDVPTYRHQECGPVFVQLRKMIAGLLDVKESQGYDLIPLTAAGQGRHQARIDKDSLLQPTSALYLAISTEEIAEGVVLDLAARIIVASPDRIDQKIELNLRGLPLQLVTVPPPAIPRRRNTWYYQLDTRGSSAEAVKDWEAIAMGRALVIHVPRDLQGASFELLGLEGRR